MLAAVFCHVSLVLRLHVIQQCSVVIDNVLLAQGAGVIDHLNYLPLRVTVELLVLHDGEVLVLVVAVLPQTREVDGLVALTAEGLDTAGEGVAVQPAGEFLDRQRGGQLGLLEDGGVGGLARLPLPVYGDVIGELLDSRMEVILPRWRMGGDWWRTRGRPALYTHTGQGSLKGKVGSERILDKAEAFSLRHLFENKTKELAGFYLLTCFPCQAYICP